jgi:hypothetical protein
MTKEIMDHASDIPLKGVPNFLIKKKREAVRAREPL